MQRLFTPHVTVATVVAQQSRFLIVEELIDGQVMYNQPAGHLEQNENLIAAAQREVLEETAWDVDITGYLGVCVYSAPNGTTYVRHSFCGQAVRHHADRSLDNGIVAAHWLQRTEIEQRYKQLRSPMILATIDEYLAGRVYPLAMVSQHR